MQSNPIRSATPWRALLWKDFHQVKQVLLAIVLGLAAIQFSLLAAGSLVSEPASTKIKQLAISFAFIAPVLGGLGCSGMLIGHELQSRTWAWSSSLPVSWRYALASKLLVSILSSFLLIVPLLIISAPTFNQPWVWRGSLSEIYLTPIVYLIAFEVIVFVFICNLLFRDPLNGMVVGALWLVGTQLTIVGWTTPLIYRLLGYGATPAKAELWLISGQMVLLTALGAVVLSIVFRRRWGLGQLAIWQWPGSMVSVSTPRRVSIRAGKPPGLWRMLLVHSFRLSLAMRVSVTLATILLAIALVNARDPVMFLLVACVASGLLGLTSFEGDQTHGRIQFLAERGVSPAKLVSSRLLAPVVISGFLCTILMLQFFWHDDVRGFPVTVAVFGLACPAVFLVSALSSLCFNKPVVAAVVAAVATAAGVVMVPALQSLSVINGSVDPSPYWLTRISFYCSPISLAMLLIAIYTLAPKWIIRSQPKLGRHFPWITGMAALTPTLLATCVGFLAIPKVAWQGLPASDVARETARVPPLSNMDLLLPGVDANLQLSRRFPTVENLHQVFASCDKSLQGEQGLQNMGQLEASLKQLDLDLQSTPQTPEDSFQTTYRLRRLISETAVLGAYLVQFGQPESARRAWQCNKRLQEIAMEWEWYATSTERISSYAIWLQLTDEEILELGGADQIRTSMLPDDSRSRDLLAQWFRRHATLARETLYGHRVGPSRGGTSLPQYPWSTMHVPPLRWREERVLAFNLSQTLAALQRGDFTSPTMSWRVAQFGQYRIARERLQHRLDSLPANNRQETGNEKKL